MPTYILYDTFNRREISRHRTLDAAVKADRAFQRRVKRANGPTSFIPTEILKNGQKLDDDEYEISLCLLNKLA